jgi:hypothetical protein
MKRVNLVAAAVGAFACASCVSFRFERTVVNTRPERGAVEALAPGAATLADCLARLGAPLYVWELPGTEMALAWGWERNRLRGFSVSVPLDHGGSASASYDDLARKLHGFVLQFDASGKLTSVRRGYLSDLATEFTRRRPAAVAGN